MVCFSSRNVTVINNNIFAVIYHSGRFFPWTWFRILPAKLFLSLQNINKLSEDYGNYIISKKVLMNMNKKNPKWMNFVFIRHRFDVILSNLWLIKIRLFNLASRTLNQYVIFRLDLSKSIFFGSSRQNIRHVETRATWSICQQKTNELIE